jgi:hypothetical protein
VDMRLVVVGVVLALLLSYPQRAWACMAHYISVERFVKHARTIVEVEVLSVQPAPPSGSRHDSPTARENAMATVRVLRAIRGGAGVQTLDIIGGPYASCDPSPVYLSFAKGEHSFLVLPSDLPATTKTVVIRHADEVLKKTADEMDALLAKSRKSWSRTLELHRKVDPEACAMAEEILRATGKAAARSRKTQESPFPVLSCLQRMAEDPERRPPAADEPETREEVKVGNVPLFFGRRWLAKPERSTRAQVVAYNRRLFEIFLADRLALTRREISTVAARPCIARQWQESSFDPEQMNLECEERKDLATIGLLRDLDSLEPDGLESRLFGGVETSVGDPMLIRYVDRDPARVFEGRALGILLRIPEPGLVTAVEKSLTRANEAWELSDFFEFFLRIHDYGRARDVLAKIEQVLLHAPAKKGADAKARRGDIEQSLSDLQEAVEKQGCREPSLLEALAGMRKRLKPGE